MENNKILGIESSKYTVVMPKNAKNSENRLAINVAAFLGIETPIVTDEEKPEAFRVLLRKLKEENDHLDTGVLGARVIFHVLAQAGFADKAYKMIVGPEFPSYGNLVMRGATSLLEQFYEYVSRVSSMNHHFWGDVSAFFIRRIAGLDYNPRLDGELSIHPSFVPSLSYAEASHDSPKGKIIVRWERNNDDITLKLDIPEGINATLSLDTGYALANSDGTSASTIVTSGSYKIIKAIK